MYLVVLLPKMLKLCTITTVLFLIPSCWGMWGEGSSHAGEGSSHAGEGSSHAGEGSSSAANQERSKYTGNFYRTEQAMLELSFKGSGFHRNQKQWKTSLGLGKPPSPIVLIYEKNPQTNTYNLQPTFMTNTVQHESNPKFDISYRKVFNFEDRQLIKMMVYDQALNDEHYLGESAEISLASILQQGQKGPFSYSPYSWRIDMAISTLCNANTVCPIKLELLDNGITIASVITSLGELMDQDKTLTFDPDNFGYLEVEYLKIDEYYAFTSYIQNGLQMKCSVAINFKESHGDPFNPDFMDAMDDYEVAIKTVVPVILDFDYEKKVPVYGFGAEGVSDDNKLSFAVNFQPRKPECIGIEGIIKAYRKCLHHITVDGRAVFEPSITRQAAFIEKQLEDARKKGHEHMLYFVLFMLTTGPIDDFENTKKAIIKASKLPLSIIIIGFGTDGFLQMRELADHENNVLRDSDGNEAERDIITFVYLNGHQNDLKQTSLSKIPRQIATYMENNNYAPPPSKINYYYGEIINKIV